MANDSGVKPKKVRGGWIEVEEPTAIESTASEAPPVANTSANEAPKTLSLSFDGLREAFSTVVGPPLWYQFGQGQTDLTAKQRIAVLEAVLGEDFPLSVPNVELLIAELYKPNENKWTLAGSFPAIVRIAREWLAVRGVNVEPPQSDEKTQQVRDRLKEASKRSGEIQ